MPAAWSRADLDAFFAPALTELVAGRAEVPAAISSTREYLPQRGDAPPRTGIVFVGQIRTADTRKLGAVGDTLTIRGRQVRISTLTPDGSGITTFEAG